MIIMIGEVGNNLKITQADLDLSKKQQDTIVALMGSPLSASEIAKKTKIPLTTIIVALKELKEKQMVFSEKPTIEYKVGNKTISKEADIDYWQLADKGLLWANNVCSASGCEQPEGYIEQLKKKFPKLATCML